MSGRPETMVERAMRGELRWADLPQAPHCDARVLHLPAECAYCAEAMELQEERARLGISNTGHANRAWPCPADRARGGAHLNAWPGNRPTDGSRGSTLADALRSPGEEEGD